MEDSIHLLLLGGSGFVGSALLRHLATRPPGSVRVRALLRRPDAVPDYPFLDKVAGSLTQLPADLEPHEPYVLVHFAVKHIDSDGTGFHSVNVDTLSPLLARLGTRLRGILYGSSMAVYGRGEQDGVTEGAPSLPGTPLGDSRRQAEQIIRIAALQRGISAFSLRTRFVVGEGDRFVLPGLARAITRGVGPGTGQQRLSVIHVDDYARVIMELAERVHARDREGIPLQTPFNIGYRQPIQLSQMERALASALKVTRPRIRIPAATLARLLRKVPHRDAAQLATRLELVGLSHWGDTSALRGEIGSEIIDRNPLDALQDAAAALTR